MMEAYLSTELSHGVNDFFIICLFLNFSCRERIYFQSCRELSVYSTVSAVKFCPLGKWLGVGFTSGKFELIFIETARKTRPVVSISNTNFPVASLWWHDLNEQQPNEVTGQAIGVGITIPSQEEQDDEFGELNMVEDITEQLSNVVLLVALGTQSIEAYAFGICPLFSISCSELCKHIKSGESEIAKLKFGNSFQDSSSLVISVQSAMNIFSLALPLGKLVGPRLHRATKFGQSMAKVHRGLSVVQAALETCGRKWKEACKTILPKLALLQSLLDSYQLGLTPVEFFHSVASCGLWHPAAISCFSQHWNEQGLQRLRSSVDGAAMYIIKQLQLRIMPLVGNILRSCRFIASVALIVV